ncbi:hypothetical protein [Treponema sp. OMZ 838]|uniref:hypothetical protein n=1 Tax=Treponema sp. OMZ 838 TaxID=1539298 RepID=UPI000AB3CD02|nr:hypothetical protein [Treponema sp. OMZ 838]
MCISILIALAFTAACGLQPFSSVRIKANPTVYVPLGEKSITEAEVFTKLEETLQKNNKNIRLYRYQPSGGDDKLRYLVHYPLQTLELDISKYFNGDPLGNGGSGDTNLLSRKFDTEISIPKINESKSFKINAADINQKLLEKFNTDTPLFVSVPAISGEHTLPPVNIEFHGFEKITFGSGSYLEISTSPNSGSYTITKAKMESNECSIPGDITGHNVRFLLDNKTIGNNISLTLTVKDVSGVGNLTVNRTLYGMIIRATGVTANPEITPASGTVDIPLPEDFRSATIGEGKFKLSMDMPADWTGITIEEQTKITQAVSGGLAINPGSFQPLNTPVSLAGKTLNNQRTLTYEPKLKVKLDSATYTYQENLSVKFNFSIDKFAAITMTNKADFNKPQSEPVPDGIKGWVKNIEFNTASVKIKLKNGLPAGNDINIRLSSDCFKITPAVTKTFAYGETEQAYDCNNGNAFVLDIETLDNFDLTTAVLLPGYNEHDNTFTLNNIRTDSKIEFSGAVQFNFDWKKIILKAKADQNISFPQTGKMDLSELTSKLKTAGIQLEEIPAYFYAGSDSGLLGSTKMSVKLTATYIKTGETTDTPAVLVDKSNITLKALPAGTFPSDKIFTGTIPKAMLSIKHGESGIEKTLAGIMNDYPKDLQLTCTLNMMEGIVINRADYNNLKDKKPKVSIDLVLDVPVGFKVGSEQTPSLMDMFGINMSGADLFGRRSAHDKPFGLDDQFQILDSLRSIQVRINLKNDLSGPVPKCILRFKDGSGNAIKGESNKPIKKEIAAAAGESTVTLTSLELKKLLEKYPVSPELVLELQPGSYSLKRDFKLGASLSVSAETGIDYSMKVN